MEDIGKAGAQIRPQAKINAERSVPVVYCRRRDQSEGNN